MRKVARWLLASCSVTGCLATAPASAQVDDYVIVSDVTPSDSDFSKSVGVECPVGTSVLGGGTSSSGEPGIGLVASRALVDSGAGIGWQSTSQELIATPGSWQLQGFAICGNVPGLERITDTSPLDSELKEVEVLCPAGKRAISGGFELSGAITNVAVFKSAALLDETSNESIGWSFLAFERSPNPGAWGLEVEVLCADVDVVVARTIGSTSNEPYRSLTMYCPGRTLVLGGGGYFFGVLVDWITSLEPLLNSSAWTTRIDRDETDTSPSSLLAMVVCPSPDRALLGVAAIGSLSLVARGQRARARRSNT
jgi:hypothetical protein